MSSLENIFDGILLDPCECLHRTVNIMTDSGVVTGELQIVGSDGIQLEESNGYLVMIPIVSIRAILA
ncbi:hypothetical protein [Thermoactinomyces sp. DSM 45892]|uniref:hypothetical protein n=1 Tax=Thermoactinomyces sp. DSM 45892 TaxID=1882753 RepID=UPI00089D0DA1|nr:hypothetical protein [Thermoactinomyces sp. DSM 45892]SDX99538.1 hypothetical protein SAMN05444416_101197 [Thermoactinomyces sp. DSM 45892]